MAEEWRQYSGRWNLQTQGQAAGAFKWPGVVIPERLWGWGVNNNGQIGYGDTTNYSSPVQVGSLSWPEISAGATFSLAVDPNGKLWSTGQNNYGQLGLGNTASYSSFTQVGALTTWSKPAALGGEGSANAAIKTDGTLWTWGYNAQGQLADGTTNNKSSPIQVGSLTTWSKTTGGNIHSGATASDGTLWTWGAGSTGQLGHGNTTSYSSPVQVGALTTWSVLARASTANLFIGLQL